MSKELPNLYWIEDLLPSETLSRKMFGGVAYYLDDKLVLILIETDESHMHRGLEYPFGIWNGCLFPVEKIKQNTVFLKFPFLTNHPASSKWLYLPQDGEGSENFEDHANTMIREIKKRNRLLGTYPASATKKPKKKPEDAGPSTVVNTRKPTLFSETVEKPAAKVKKTAKKSTKKAKANKKPGNTHLLGLLKRKNN